MGKEIAVFWVWNRVRILEKWVALQRHKSTEGYFPGPHPASPKSFLSRSLGMSDYKYKGD